MSVPRKSILCAVKASSRCQVIKLVNNDGEIIFILEPGNITKLQMGEPLSVNLKELGIPGQLKVYYCPDVIRLAIDLANHKVKAKCIDAKWLEERIAESLDWRPLDRVAN